MWTRDSLVRFGSDSMLSTTHLPHTAAVLWLILLNASRKEQQPLLLYISWVKDAVSLVGDCFLPVGVGRCNNVTLGRKACRALVGHELEVSGQLCVAVETKVHQLYHVAQQWVTGVYPACTPGAKAAQTTASCDRMHGWLCGFSSSSEVNERNVC